MNNARIKNGRNSFLGDRYQMIPFIIKCTRLAHFDACRINHSVLFVPFFFRSCFCSRLSVSLFLEIKTVNHHHQQHAEVIRLTQHKDMYLTATRQAHRKEHRISGNLKIILNVQKKSLENGWDCAFLWRDRWMLR